MIRARHTLPLALVCCAGGLGAASLASGAKEKPRATVTALPPVVYSGCPAALFPSALEARRGTLQDLVARGKFIERGNAAAAGKTRRKGTRTAPSAVPPVTKRAPAPKAAPSARLLGAFGVLRRPRATTDTLPQSALKQLLRSGARFEPGAVRLLRTTPRGGRAWIVPVADVGAFGCGALLPSAAPAIMNLRPLIRSRGVPNAEFPKLRAQTQRVLRDQAERLRRSVPALPAPPVAIAPTAVYPRPGRGTLRALRPQLLQPSAPREGVVVVATGDTPGGGGGALADLTRARGVPVVEPCSGPGGKLTAVSGLAPDGVTEAFLTSTDGTAIKAKVVANAYSFIVAPARTPEPRYVVWTKDGRPQVMPVLNGLLALPRGLRDLRCAPRPASLVRVDAGRGTNSGSYPSISALQFRAATAIRRATGRRGTTKRLPAPRAPKAVPAPAP